MPFSLSCARLAEAGPHLADPREAPWPPLPPQPLAQGEGWVKAAWSKTALHLLLFAPAPAPGERLGLCLDPVGDGIAFFEFHTNAAHAVSQAVFRANRSGFKKNAAWRCEELASAVSETSEGLWAEFAVPFAGLGSLRPPGPWRASAWRTPGFPYHRPEAFGLVTWG